MFERKNSFAKFAITFGFGVLAGAVLGVLYAPMAGKKLQRKVADVTDKVIDKVDDLQETVRKIAKA